MNAQPKPTRDSRSDIERILMRIAQEPGFRQQLLASPAATLSAEGLSVSLEAAEVSGYRPCTYTCSLSCARGTCRITK